MLPNSMGRFCCHASSVSTCGSSMGDGEEKEMIAIFRSDRLLYCGLYIRRCGRCRRENDVLTIFPSDRVAMEQETGPCKFLFFPDVCACRRFLLISVLCCEPQLRVLGRYSWWWFSWLHYYMYNDFKNYRTKRKVKVELTSRLVELTPSLSRPRR